MRGYYHLTRTVNLEELLNTWDSLSSDRSKELSGWLIGLCQNQPSFFGDKCENKFSSAVRSSSLWSFYQKYLPAGKRQWDSFYGIQGRRSDIKWDSNDPSTMSIPFRNPRDPEVKAFLIDNLSDEFSWNGWSMKLDFVNSSNVPYIRFVDGATPVSYTHLTLPTILLV